jgi:type IV pilus assembly protein PilO
MRARGKEIYIITAVVAVVLIVAWYFLLFSPKQRELDDLDQQVESAQMALTEAQNKVVELEAYKKTAPQSRAEVVRLGKMLPTSEGIPGLIIELTKTAEASGVSVTSIARGTTTAGSPYGIQTLTLQVSGRYFDVEDFLYRLEEYVAFRNASFRVTGRLLQVTQLTMQAATTSTTETTTSGSPPLAVTIGLNAYLWGGTAQTASTADAAAAGGAQ